MILSILRGIFILLAALVTVTYVLGSQEGQNLELLHVVTVVTITLGFATVIIAADILTPHKKLAAMSGVLMGVIAGLVAAFALSFVVDFVAMLKAPEVNVAEPKLVQVNLNDLGFPYAFFMSERTGRATEPATAPESALATQPRILATSPRLEQIKHLLDEQKKINEEQKRLYDIQRERYDHQVMVRRSFFNLMQGVKVWIGLVTCYLGISLVLQTKGDFRFIVPYVEFAKEIRGTRPILVDTSVIIDGRILDIVQTHLLQVGLIVPKFVLQELQTIADSGDKLKRARGRRGLDILHKLQQNPAIALSIDETEAEGATVDQKLVSLATQLNARIMTNDFNLNKLAVVRGLTVINLNDLAAALRPVVLPGETMRIKVVKPGEGPSQGVGYLDDGTMVVVEAARSQVGQEIELVVTSMLQTSAGRMIFGRLANGNEAGPSAGRPK